MSDHSDAKRLVYDAAIRVDSKLQNLWKLDGLGAVDGGAGLRKIVQIQVSVRERRLTVKRLDPKHDFWALAKAGVREMKLDGLEVVFDEGAAR